MLSSGGIESAVLLAKYAERYTVFPIYVQCGFVWENQEQIALRQFISSLNNPNIQSVVVIKTDLDNIYDNHWSKTGHDFPTSGTPDSAVIIPGRNFLLLSMAVLWCITHRCDAIAMGILGSAEIYDQQEAFFRQYEQLLPISVNKKIRILTDFRGLSKSAIIRENQSLSLNLTFTCMLPVNGMHCGKCNKCEERQRAMARAGIKDFTQYDAALA